MVFTLVSRAVGIAWSSHRYFWLTGMFFGSRLAEFAAGMVVAIWIARRAATDIPRALQPGRIVLGAAACYLVGLGASIFLWGALVSNLLVTVGLTGLFYGLWHILRRSAPVGRAIISARRGVVRGVSPASGAASVDSRSATYARHGARCRGRPRVGDVDPWSSGGRALDGLDRAGPRRLDYRHGRLLTWVIGVPALALMFLMEPHLTADGRAQRGLCVLLAAVVALMGWLEWSARRDGTPDPVDAQLVRRMALASAFATLFVLPAGYGYLAVIGGVLVGCAVTGVQEMRGPGSGVRGPGTNREPGRGARRLASDGRRIPDAGSRLLISWATGVALTLCILAGAEVFLARFAPTEVGGWGERAALEVHPTRAYGLIPNRVTHSPIQRLRLHRPNGFARTARTGGDARAGDTDTFRLLAVGDAFTMPEGLDYEYSYPALLQGALRRCGTTVPVDVIDGGVTGYGPNEEGPEINELAPLLRPNVIIYQFYVNEWSDIQIDSASRRRNIGLVHGRLGRTDPTLSLAARDASRGTLRRPDFPDAGTSALAPALQAVARLLPAWPEPVIHAGQHHTDDRISDIDSRRSAQRRCGPDHCLRARGGPGVAPVRPRIHTTVGCAILGSRNL